MCIRDRDKIDIPPKPKFQLKYNIAGNEAGLNYLIDESKLTARTTYLFTVQAKNSLQSLIGEASKPKMLEYNKNTIKVESLNVSSVQDTQVTLQWETPELNVPKPKQAFETLTYKINYKPYDQNEVNYFEDINLSLIHI